MSGTVVPSMLVEDIELRMRPSLLVSLGDPMICDHLWEPHVWELAKAYCPHCGSLGRWVNDPRVGAA